MTDTEKMLSDRFGMFVHWGLYSILGGEWKGQTPATHPLGEWIMHSLQIPLEEYGALAAEFKPAPDYAHKLVAAAKGAGMRYIVITSKHHDGFCLFKSGVSGYNSFDMCGRDLIAELAEECRDNNIKLGFYYSHTLDWAEKDGGGSVSSSAGAYKAKNDNYWDYPDRENKSFETYFYGKAIPQVRELLTNYKDVYLMWFDYAHNITVEQADALYKTVKELQPHCLVNSRIAHGRGDYNSLGDNMIPSAPLNIPSECLVTLNDTWGYKKHDSNWKNSEDMIEMLVRSISSGSTLLLNVGPMADGSLTAETASILRRIGDWVSRNSEAVYGVSANPFKTVFDWGYVSQKNNDLYLYIADGTDEITLTGIRGELLSVTGLDGSAAAFIQKDDSVIISLPHRGSDYFMPVYAVRFTSKPEISGIISQCGRTLNLIPVWAKKFVSGESGEKPHELIIEHNIYDPTVGTHGLAISRAAIVTSWKNASEILRWSARFTSPGYYEAELITAPCAYKNGIRVTVGAQEVHTAVPIEKRNYRLSKTGRDNIRQVFSIGNFRIDNPGIFEVSLSRTVSDNDNLPVARLKFTLV